MERTEALKILELTTNNPTDEEVKKAYRRLSLIWHPDRFGGEAESKITDAVEKFKKINEAYGTLNGFSGSDFADNSDDLKWIAEIKIKQACEAFELEVEEVLTEEYQQKLKDCKTREELDQVLSNFYFWIQVYSRAVKSGYIKRKQKLNKNQEQQARGWYKTQQEALDREIEQLEEELKKLERMVKQKKQGDKKIKIAVEITVWLIVALLAWWAIRKIMGWVKAN